MATPLVDHPVKTTGIYQIPKACSSTPNPPSPMVIDRIRPFSPDPAMPNRTAFGCGAVPLPAFL
eukprot:CAMPEP_0183781134 /NCGR_PEP_ID=MMETSP0739-20130205/57991_1 /TAXON_ID=385413 /ORGANISM="Thalassiosira miniscula, Strain CCMP1093" /LENGTH=63 /DNA_ID=CAMNT_0026024249 /DNA_START=390 /DNA_END=578 /DNA_ORIENTATION=+